MKIDLDTFEEITNILKSAHHRCGIIWMNNIRFHFSNINIEKSNFLSFYIKYINCNIWPGLGSDILHRLTMCPMCLKSRDYIKISELLKHPYLEIKTKNILFYKIGEIAEIKYSKYFSDEYKNRYFTSLNDILKVLLKSELVLELLEIKDDTGNDFLYYCELYELNEIVEMIKIKLR